MRRTSIAAAALAASLVVAPAVATTPEPPADPICEGAVWVVDQEAVPPTPVVQHRDYLWTRLVWRHGIVWGIEGRWFHEGETPDAEWTWTGLWKLHVVQPYQPGSPEVGHWECPDPEPEPGDEPTPVPSDEPAEPDEGDDGTPIPAPAEPATARVTAPTFTG